MVIGEGLVFLVILMLGAFYVVRSLKREWRIARLQRNFLLAVSHEMRSPIAAMKLYLQTLQKRDLEVAKKETVIQGALASADRLRDLTDNIMTALRIEDGSLELQIQNMDIVPLTKEIVHVLEQTLAKAHQIKLELPNSCHVHLDAQAYRSIVGNLLENAIKYSKEGSTIHVRLDPEHCTLQVQDEGLGIGPKEQRMVFQRFYRSGNEETRSSTGTGLGLYIVKSLCEDMGGSIQLDSELGKGSTFAITFPK